MKRILLLAVFVITIQPNSTFAQKQARSKQPAGPDLEQYSYAFYTALNGPNNTLSGCFIKYKDSSYFVTARSHFYTPVNELRKLSNIVIFMEPGNLRDNARAVSINMKSQRILPVCIDSVCADIILLPIEVPAEYKINYLEFNSRDELQGKEMSIVGYVQDTSHIIETRFFNFLSRDKNYFLTEKSNIKDQLGSPVIIVNRNKGNVSLSLAGIYAGRELSKENFNRGLICRASLISDFFESLKEEKKIKPATPIKINRKKAKMTTSK